MGEVSKVFFVFGFDIPKKTIFVAKSRLKKLLIITKSCLKKLLI